jgi:hypothetical protein
MDKESTKHLTHGIVTKLPIHGVATMFDPTFRATRFGGGRTNHAYGTTKHGTSTTDSTHGTNEIYEPIKILPFNY